MNDLIKVYAQLDFYNGDRTELFSQIFSAKRMDISNK